MIPFADVYLSLQAAHGPQRWWPADDPFEVMAGAVLVQRTTWRSAAAALAKLRESDLLAPEPLARAPAGVVERCVRGAGFFRTKAARLRKLAGFVVEQGGTAGLEAVATAELRGRLLGREGIGPETADAILLYAFDRPAVVVDSYLRRLAQRLMAAAEPPSDSRLRGWVESAIEDARHLNEFHALVVAHGQDVCGRQPACRECGISGLCRTGRDVQPHGRALSDA